jgi:PIN domain nuclease of toxin-antitoxin system
VLDTHIWFWMMTGERPLQPATQSEIDRTARRHELVIPVISIWELAMLNAKGRIRFKEPIADWVAESLALPGLRLAQLTPSIAILCHQLPGSLQADPADRLIIATAMELDATLVTRDAAILAYGDEGHIKVLPA